MHWSPEHAAPLSQWPEQHLDVTSTTSPPSAHKHDPYAAAARRSFAPAAGYPWASDDISALTASSLLKRYAEKYSGLELTYDRPPATAAAASAYSEPGAFLKTESEPWALGQGVECYLGLEALSGGAKVGSGSVGVPATGSVTVVSEPGYSGPPSQEYPPAYNSTYLPSGYCPQPSAALPPATLHSLQAAPTLVPTYSASAPVYNYYPPQSGYSHPSASYLPAPTPLAPRPTVVGGSYSYAAAHGLGGGEGGGTAALKRKAFEMSEEGQEAAAELDGPRYRKYGNGKGNGYDLSGGGASGKPLLSPPYGGGNGGVGPDYSPPSGLAGESNFPQQQRMSMKIPATHTRSEDSAGGR